MQNRKLKSMTTMAFCVALICVLAQITIPFPLVPITLQTFAIALIAMLLPPKQTFITVCTYLIMGLIGIPVFSHFTSGLAVLFGPTGGFLWSFPVMAYSISKLCLYYSYQKWSIFIINILAMLFNLLFGSIWLKYNLNIPWESAFAAGFTPFIIVGIIKVLLVVPFAQVLRHRLTKAKLLYT